MQAKLYITLCSCGSQSNESKTNYFVAKTTKFIQKFFLCIGFMQKPHFSRATIALCRNNIDQVRI